ARAELFPPHYPHILPPEGVWLRVVVGNVWQVLARHSQPVRKVIIPCSDHYLLGIKLRCDSLLVASVHAKTAIAALNSLDALAQSQFQRIVLSALTIIFERLGARGLLRRTGEW